MTPHACRSKANQIARELSHLNPYQAVGAADGSTVSIVFTIIPSDDDKPWFKAVEVEADLATANLVQDMLDGWRMGVLMQIADDNPSPVVNAAMEKFGYERVLQAMRPTNGSH
jgi:hypothetical protein